MLSNRPSQGSSPPTRANSRETRRRQAPPARTLAVSRGQGDAPRPSGVNRIVFLMSLVAGIPAASLLAAGNPQSGGACFWVLFGLFFSWLLLGGKPVAAAALALGTTPFMNLFRQFAFYNVVVSIFGLLLVLLHSRGTAEARRNITGNVYVQGLIAYMGIYYLVSWVITGVYSNNLRLMEFAFSATCLVWVSRDRAALVTSLLAVMASSCLVGCGMLPHNDSVGRLGMAIVNGMVLGNPVQLGLPLALSFLALCVDRGSWMGLERRPKIRAVLVLVVALLLALTTSRIAWFVAALGVISVLLFGQGQRLRIVALVVVAGIAIQLALLTRYGEALQKGYERTFGDDRDVGKRSSGRSDQWLVAYEAFTSSAQNALVGCGPGNGPQAYAEYSMRAMEADFHAGDKMALHSLFMQVGVEAGLLGLVPLGLWLALALQRVLQYTKRLGLMLPAICFCSYILIVTTVSGNDTISGAFLGLGLTGAIAGGPPGSLRRRGPPARPVSGPPQPAYDVGNQTARPGRGGRAPRRTPVRGSRDAGRGLGGH